MFYIHKQKDNLMITAIVENKFTHSCVIYTNTNYNIIHMLTCSVVCYYHSSSSSSII